MMANDLSQLELLAAHACRASCWAEASVYCERYLDAWRTSGDLATKPWRVSENRLPFLTKLGQTIATMHDKGFLHGTLLLENITPDGALKNFTRSRSTDPEFNARVKDLSQSGTAAGVEALKSGIDALVKNRRHVGAGLADRLDDLRPLRHQLNAEEWSAFEAGYSGTARFDVFGALSRESGKEADYPALRLRAPSLTIRMCAHLVREQGFAVAADEISRDIGVGERSKERDLDIPLDQDEDEDEGESGAPQRGEFELSDAVLAHVRHRDWFRAASALRMELDTAELQSPESPYCLFLAAQYAKMLLQCAEFLPQQKRRLAIEVRDLVLDYGELILDSAARERGTPGSGASNANNLGWAAVKLSHGIEDGESLLRSGLELLERAVDAAPRAVAPESYSIYANNLAMACRDLSEFDSENQAALLRRAADLMREVQSIDREFLKSRSRARRSIGQTLYIDLANLSRVCLGLGIATYDAKWINRKPLASARWFREALDTALESRQFAAQIDRIENIADADILAAQIYLWLCRQYMTERRWAGGDLTRAFYEWLCEFAGGWVNTGQFVRDCAASALEHLCRAAYVGIDRNPSVLVEVIDSMVALWALSMWNEGIPVDVGRHSLLTLLETLRRVDENGMLDRFIGEPDQIRDVGRYLKQILVLDCFQAGLCGTNELGAAHRALDQISSGASIPRALARPYRTAIQFDESGSMISLNGLVLERRANCLSLRLASLRRDVSIEGLHLLDAECVLKEAEFLRSLSAQSDWAPPTDDELGRFTGSQRSFAGHAYGVRVANRSAHSASTNGQLAELVA